MGSKKTFASALDWPGWSRVGKGEDDALRALIDYAPRYAKVAARAGVPFPARLKDVDTVERLKGNATTDFGAPGVPAALESQPLGKAEVDRLCALLEACWAELDSVAKGAPAELRKGPRGGGRDRDKILHHVLDAESGYAPKLGLRLPALPLDDRKGIAAHRRAILQAIRGGADGRPLREGGPSGRYWARRIGWHALDHAWEIEDRSEV